MDSGSPLARRPGMTQRIEDIYQSGFKDSLD